MLRIERVVEPEAAKNRNRPEPLIPLARLSRGNLHASSEIEGVCAGKSVESSAGSDTEFVPATSRNAASIVGSSMAQGGIVVRVNECGSGRGVRDRVLARLARKCTEESC